MTLFEYYLQYMGEICEGKRPAPAGMMLDNETEIRQHAAQIYKQAIELKAMPIGNLTNMTEAERSELGAWLQQTMQGAK